MHDQLRQRTTYCPRCNRHGIRTYEEDGVEKYRTHPHVEGGEASCHNSGQPVQEASS